MYTGRIVFSQLMDFMPIRDFRRCVRRYRGDHGVRSFSCLDQFLCLAFAQLTFRESLRDIETCLRAMRAKLYHAGICGKVSRSTLADANEMRDWRIYADFAQVLIGIARKMYAKDDFGITLEQTAYVFDSTTIDLCLTLFPWAKFRRRKSAVKLHTLLDLRGNIPCFIHITGGRTTDSLALDELILEPGAFYIMDRGYIDFARLYRFTVSAAYFVVRSKNKLIHHWRASRRVDKSAGLQSDQTIVLSGPLTSQKYPAARQLLRCRAGQAIGFLDEQLYAVGVADCTAVQVPLAGGAFLQVDQAVSSDQGVLRHVGQCGEDADLDSHQCLRVGSDCEERAQHRPQFGRNPANS